VNDELQFEPPSLDDPEILARAPEALAELLRETNGAWLHGGGLHVRGACTAPSWHSLRLAWEGELALHTLYPEVRNDDVPFAQDCVGDQFLLRDGIVHVLEAETGRLEATEVGLREFLIAAERDPGEFLALQPLQTLREQGGALRPGQLILVYPPFCMASEEPATLEVMPAAEVLRLHARLARKLSRND